MQQSELETQLTAGFRRLAEKGFIHSSFDSLSVRVPATGEMLLSVGFENWQDIAGALPPASAFPSRQSIAELHARIYSLRSDAGAIAIASSNGVRLLAKGGGALPALFDEQVRHIGLPGLVRLEETQLSKQQVANAFRRGRNAALLGERIICLGMTCERAVFNTELFEKCAQAYVISSAAGMRAGVIPGWVRLIASRRLKKDQRNAAASILDGRVPDNISGY